MSKLTTKIYLHPGVPWVRQEVVVPFYVQAAMKDELERNPEQWKNNEWALANQLKITVHKEMRQTGELETIYLREGNLIGIAFDVTTEELALFNQRMKAERARWDDNPTALLEAVRQELWEPIIGRENAMWSHRDPKEFVLEN